MVCTVVHPDSFHKEGQKFQNYQRLTVDDSVFRNLLFRLCSLKIVPKARTE